jgi:hypothetical protein
MIPFRTVKYTCTNAYASPALEPRGNRRAAARDRRSRSFCYEIPRWAVESWAGETAPAREIVQLLTWALKGWAVSRLGLIGPQKRSYVACESSRTQLENFPWRNTIILQFATAVDDHLRATTTFLPLAGSTRGTRLSAR